MVVVGKENAFYAGVKAAEIRRALRPHPVHVRIWRKAQAIADNFYQERLRTGDILLGKRAVCFGLRWVMEMVRGPLGRILFKQSDNIRDRRVALIIKPP